MYTNAVLLQEGIGTILLKKFKEIIAIKLSGVSDEEALCRAQISAIQVLHGLAPFAEKADVYDEEREIKLYWNGLGGPLDKKVRVPSVSMYVATDGNVTVEIITDEEETRYPPIYAEGSVLFAKSTLGKMFP